MSCSPPPVTRAQSEMNWYLGYFVMHREATEANAFDAREYACLVEANDDKLAYARVAEVLRTTAGKASVGVLQRWMPDGISGLSRTLDPPESGGELTWSQSELDPGLIGQLLPPRERLLLLDGSSAALRAVNSGWYLCRVLLKEVHDTGSHGDSILTWENTHLIEAASPEQAFDAALVVGRFQASAGQHLCDDDRAHWEFVGITSLIESLEIPANGSLLFYREFEATVPDIRDLVKGPNGTGGILS
jgi:Domain of unknown function (DUF4288)